MSKQAAITIVGRRERDDDGPLGTGLSTDERGAQRRAEGKFSRCLFHVGLARQETSMESIAVPELRAQAFELRGYLTRDAKSGASANDAVRAA